MKQVIKSFCIGLCCLAASFSLAGCCGNGSATQWKVTFDTGDRGSDIQSQLVNNNGFVTRPTENPTRSILNFVDWYTSKVGGQVFNFSTRIKANTTIFARWQIEPLYEIFEIQAKQDYVSAIKPTANVNSVVIWQYYGTYSGKVALVIFSGGTIDEGLSETVADLSFFYADSISLIRIWHDRTYYRLGEAYDQGLLTKENIGTINFLHKMSSTEQMQLGILRMYQ